MDKLIVDIQISESPYGQIELNITDANTNIYTYMIYLFC